MGLLDGLIGGAVGAGLATVVQDVMEKHGGLQGMINEFQAKGFGEAAKSWVGMGPNQAISGDDMHKVLGADTLNALAQKTGLPLDDLKAKLAQILPQAVDKLTPDGKIPA